LQQKINVPLDQVLHIQVTTPEEDTALVDVVNEEDACQEVSTRRCVKFDDSMCEVYEITPYSEIYGIHPRDFVFDKFYFMLPADGVTDVGAAWKRRNFIDEEDDSEGASDEDLLADDWEYEYTM
jgi:hypothetical protein